MKICFFLGGFHQNGGIGRVTSLLANRLAQNKDYNVVALCYNDLNMPNLYKLSDSIDQRFFLKNRVSMTQTLMTGGIIRLRQFLKENQIDVIVACGALFFPITTLACKGIKTKSICWEHSDPEGNSDHRGQYYARRFGIKRADMNVVLTKSALKVYMDKYKVMRTVQIYNPVDDQITKLSGYYEASNKKILSVGRLTYQKNFQAAVLVAKNVLPYFPDWEWDIYGQGEDLDELIKLAKEGGIEKQIHFCGQVDNLYECYKNYSFMVMTSRYEGFPMSLLEGLGNGLPLISFDIPTGPNEIIENGFNGFLIPEGDIRNMANKMVQLMQDQQLRLRMSRNSKEKSEQFSIHGICDKWDKILKEVVNC